MLSFIAISSSVVIVIIINNTTSSVIHIIIVVIIINADIDVTLISNYWEWCPCKIKARIETPIPCRIVWTVIRNPKRVVDYGSISINRLVNIIISIHKYITYNLNLNSIISISFHFYDCNVLKSVAAKNGLNNN